MQNIVRVGIGVIIIKGNEYLVGKRKGSFASGLVSFPGGKLDFNETWEECVLREVKEECGENLKIEINYFSENRKEFFVTNDIMPKYGIHYITIFMVARWVSGEPENAEPEKCEGWSWVDYETLKELVNKDKTADWIPIDLISSMRNQIEFTK